MCDFTIQESSKRAGRLLLWGRLLDPSIECNLVTLWRIDEFGVEVVSEIGPDDAGAKLFVPAGAEEGLDPKLRTLPMARACITRSLERLRTEGVQIVGYPQFVPMEGQPEWLLRCIGRYVGQEEAAQHPFVAPADLPADLVHEGLDPRIVEMLALMGVESRLPAREAERTNTESGGKR